MMTAQKNTPTLRFPEFSDKWEVKKLGDIAKFSKGKGISKADIEENGSFECIRYGELYTRYGETIKDVVSKTNIEIGDLVLSEANDVIIPASGETQLDIATASCVLKSGVALGGDLNIIKTKDNGVFLSFYLNNSKKKDIASLSQGVSVVHLYPSQLATLTLNLPQIAEQTKIANFLTVVDEKIQAFKEKKRLLEENKKGLMQKIFSQEIRFKQDDGSDFPEWDYNQLNNYLFEPKKRNFDLKYSREQVLSVSGEFGVVNQIELLGRSFAGESIANYHVVENGNIVYTKSPLKANPYGIIKVNKSCPGVVSTLYAVYQCKRNADGVFLDYYFQLDDNLNKYLRPIVRKGAKNDMKVNNSDVLLGFIFIPSILEQRKIANFLTSIDQKLEKLGQQIEYAQTFKKGLLQQMFV